MKELYLQFLDDLRAENVAEEESRLWSPSRTCANPGTSRGTTRRGVVIGPGQAYHEAIPDRANGVWARVASHLRGVPVLDLPTMEQDSGSK